MTRIVLAIVLAAFVSGVAGKPARAQLYDYPGAYARGIAPSQPSVAHGQRVAPSQYMNSFQCIPASCPTAAHGGVGSPMNAITGTQRGIGAGMIVPAIQGLTPSPSKKVR
jgi:hypothetical protein